MIFKRISVTFLFVILMVVSCSGQSISRLTAGEFDQKIKSDENIVILDVRTSAEFESGHIKGALNADFRSANFMHTISTFDKSKTYLLYCRSGGRSLSAAKKMQQAGFKNIYDLKGGIIVWQNAGKPVVK